MNKPYKSFLINMEKYDNSFDKIKDTIISNLIMIGETPAPTFEEGHRAQKVLNRFSEFGLQNCSLDEKGNACGIIPGTSGDSNILIVGHLDTIFPKTVDHTISLLPEGRVKGPAVGDDSLALAVMTTLPLLLDELDIKLGSNLIFIATTRSLGNGDIEGIRFFLDHYKKPIRAGICVEGVRLGRLSYSSYGMLRGKLSNIIPEEYDWSRFNSGGSIINMNELINHILEIPLKQKPKTSILLGSVKGGKSYNTKPRKTVLRFEIRSEDDLEVERIASQIQFLADEMQARTGTTTTFEEISRRKSGGMNFSHSLNIVAREILKNMEVTARITPSMSELSAFIAKKIPAVTIGLTTGENMEEPDEIINIAPLKKGVAQFLELIKAIDTGYCDE